MYDSVTVNVVECRSYVQCDFRSALCRKLLFLIQNLTQKAAAERVRSDQANISKAERGDPTISLDWLIRTAYLLGASRQEVGRALCG